MAGEWSNNLATISRDAFSGRLSQSATTSGCVSETGAGGCLDGNGLNGVYGVAIDPLGRFVYFASWSSNALLTFRRQG